VLFALLTTLEKAWQHMEKVEISWFLTIWLFFIPFGFFWTWFGFFSQKMSGNPELYKIQCLFALCRFLVWPSLAQDQCKASRQCAQPTFAQANLCSHFGAIPIKVGCLP